MIARSLGAPLSTPSRRLLRRSFNCPALSESATGSPVVAVMAVPMALDTSKVHPALVDATRLVYVDMLTDDQMATTVGLMTRAVGCFSAQGMNSRGVLTDNTRPFALANGSVPAPPWISSPSSPAPTHQERTAIPSDSAGPCWACGRTVWRTRPQMNGPAGCPAIWGSIMAAGATWHLVASAPNSASSGCCSLNDLVRNRT